MCLYLGFFWSLIFYVYWCFNFIAEYPKVDQDACVGCQACQGNCPQGEKLWEYNDEGKAVFKVDNKDECVQCHQCESNCPASAISFAAL